MRIDRMLHALGKPALRPVEQPLKFGEDVLIVCAGFEDRASETLKHIAGHSGDRLHVVVIEYFPLSLVNRRNEILQLCSNAGANATVFRYDRRDPSGAGEALIERLLGKARKVWVDISAMSRLLIVQLLVALSRRSDGLRNVTVLYAEAKQYLPGEADVEKELAKSAIDPQHSVMFLSSGVFDVAVLPELSSVAQLGQPIRLIAFPCFIAHQLIALRAEIQASRCTIIHGVPPLKENAWRPKAIARLNHVESIPMREEFGTSTLDYRETLDLLLTLYDQHGPLERLVIAPTGSKMQAVAVALFRSYLEDVQIVYPPPRDFAPPQEYTQGVRQLYALDLDSLVVG